MTLFRVFREGHFVRHLVPEGLPHSVIPHSGLYPFFFHRLVHAAHGRSHGLWISVHAAAPAVQLARELPCPLRSFGVRNDYHEIVAFCYDHLMFDAIVSIVVPELGSPPLLSYTSHFSQFTFATGISFCGAPLPRKRKNETKRIPFWPLRISQRYRR